MASFRKGTIHYTSCKDAMAISAAIAPTGPASLVAPEAGREVDAAPVAAALPMVEDAVVAFAAPTAGV